MLNKTFASAVFVTAVTVGLSAPTFAREQAASATAGKQGATPVAKPAVAAPRAVPSHAPAATTMLAAEQTAVVKPNRGAR